MEDLGFGILALPSRPAADFPVPAGKVLFLDRLLVPAPLSSLSADQIAVINRFRESNLSLDTQFSHLAVVRRGITHVLSAAGVKRLLEIGSGKYPFCHELPLDAYVSIDIDAEAVAHCKSIGVEAHLPLDWTGKGLRTAFDACLAIYVFHFSIDEQQLEEAVAALGPDSLVIYNVIGVDAGMSMMDRLAAYGFSGYLLRGGSLSSKEALFILGRTGAIDRLRRAADAAALVFQTLREEHQSK